MAARSLNVDALKVVASQLIVWHHLAFYGPMADLAWPLAPELFAGLARHARMAVQVFLVLGGYLALQHWLGLKRAPSLAGLVLASLKRFLRLALPLGVVLLLAGLATALASRWMPGHPSLPAELTPMAWLTHLLLLQDWLGVPALSAGVWYVAIDMQLYAVLAVLALGVNKTSTPQLTWPFGLMALMAYSWLWANRQAAWDVHALYFLGAYGLGAWVAWMQAMAELLARTRLRPGKALGAWLNALLLALLAAALWIEWRPRLVIAALTACVLLCRPHGRAFLIRIPKGAKSWLQRRADESYALFLVHFPVCLIVNAVFMRWVSATPLWQALGLLVAWLLSVAAAAAFYRAIERPWVARATQGLDRLLSRPRAV